jgi:hypothetical protein
MANEYIGQKKCKVGMGGLKCPCCAPMNMSPRRSKPIMRRLVRRRANQNIMKDQE